MLVRFEQTRVCGPPQLLKRSLQRIDRYVCYNVNVVKNEHLNHTTRALNTLKNTKLLQNNLREQIKNGYATALRRKHLYPQLDSGISACLFKQSELMRNHAASETDRTCVEAKIHCCSS